MKLIEGYRKSKRIEESEEVDKKLICRCNQFNCPVCNEKYKLKRSMFYHLKTQHKWTSEDNKQLMNECPFCKVLYWRKSDLESHITNIHRKAFNCSFCG